MAAEPCDKIFDMPFDETFDKPFGMPFDKPFGEPFDEPLDHHASALASFDQPLAGCPFPPFEFDHP